MQKNFTRSDRVAQQILRELTEIIRKEMKDPRVGMLTLTDVVVTRDLSQAKVFYSLMDSARQEEVAAALARSSGFLRSQLARRIDLFTTPALLFVYDNSIDYGVSLSKLIDEAVATAIDDTDENENA